MEQREIETGDIETTGIQRREEGALLSPGDMTNLDQVTDPYYWDNYWDNVYG